MMRRFVREHAKSAAKALSAFAALAFTLMFCLTFLNGASVNAESEVVISAITKRTEIGPGDLMMIDVVANNFPGFIEFGPIEVGFDSDKAEYVSIEQGKDLSNYVFSEIRNEGILTVTGMDQIMSISSEEGGDDTINASFKSDNQVVLFTIAIRILPESTGEINVWINSVGDFVTPTENVPARIGSGITLPIRRSGMSSDATIASLKVRGTSITPDFNPNITEYSCSVERSVTEVQVNVTTTNLWAAVVIEGSQSLNLGENIVVVDITAQDGSTHMRYTIHVTRKESNVPDNASLVDLAGNTYTFLDAPEDADVPEGFTLTTKYINGYSVPAYVKDGVSSVLLYLFDGNQTPGFYFYNSTAKTVLRYEPENTLIATSQVLKVTDIPEGVSVPSEFKPAVYTAGAMVLSGYINDDGEFICYLSDENGNGDFYFYDQTNGSISLYRFADKKAELLYSYLFDVFLVIAIIEAVIITVTVYVLKSIVSSRTNPRPKRV